MLTPSNPNATPPAITPTVVTSTTPTHVYTTGR